jgi:GTPase SAR1 family protein
MRLIQSWGKGKGSLLVTGQPGIGKTTMFDMLLHGYLSVQKPGVAQSPARVEYSAHYDYPVLIVLVNEIHIIVPKGWKDPVGNAPIVRKFDHYVANVGKSAIDAPEFQRQLDEILTTTLLVLFLLAISRSCLSCTT